MANEKENILKFAYCCGNCIHSSRPKTPNEHEAYYNVAKTERWCYKNNWYITRECVCDDFELDSKSGGVPACKRAFAFNNKVVEINLIRKKMNELNVTYIYEPGKIIYKRYSINKDKPYILVEYLSTTKYDSITRDFIPCEAKWEASYCYGPKDGETSKIIKLIKQELLKISNNKKE